MRIFSIALVALTVAVATGQFVPSQLVDQAKKCLQDSNGNKSAAVECVGKILGGDARAFIAKIEALLDGGDQKVVDFVKSKVDEITKYLESKQGLFDDIHGKAKELKDKAEGWVNSIFGKREKRDMPTQAEVQLAKQIKICIDMGSEKGACIEKVLNGKHPEIDLVKLDTIVKYEDVLKELKEFFAYKENGGTLKEFVEMKKQQNRPKRDMPTQVEVQLAKQVKICIDMGGEKGACIEKVLNGKHPEIDLVKLDTIVKYEDVLKELKEYFAYKENGGTLKEFNEMKKQQNRPKRALPQSLESLLVFKYIVDQCQEKMNKSAVVCAAILFGSTLDSAKEKIDGLINSADPRIVEFLKSAKDQLHQYYESASGLVDKAKDKATELKDKTQAWFKETFGRRKRDMPTQAEVQLAKQVKICIDMGGEKGACIEKVLNGKHPEIDLVKLDTIVKYEDVLKELKEYFAYKEQGGTLKEFNEMKKQQQLVAKGRAAVATSRAMLDTKHVLAECVASVPNKDVVRCLVSLLGPEASALKGTVEQLIKTADPEVVEFAKGKGKELHQYLEQRPGIVGKIHDIAHNVYSWVESLLG